MVCPLRLTGGRGVRLDLIPFISSDTPSCRSVLPVCLHLLFPSSTRVHVSWSNYINRRTPRSSWGFKYREVSSDEPCSHNARFCLPGSACVLITPIAQSSLCPCNYTCVFVCLCMPLKCVDMRLPESSRSSAHHIFTQFVLGERSLSGRTLHGGVSGFKSAH